MLEIISLDEPCPCGSGKLLRFCCPILDGNRVVPWDAATNPPGPKTGYSHPRCYAAVLGDCSTKISKEHYVSQSVLEMLSHEGGIFVSGLRGMPVGAGTLRSKEALQAKVLCERHNQALSGLDTAGAKFFGKLDAIVWEFYSQTIPAPWRFLMNGHDLERWMLKLVCGAIASRNHSPSLPDWDNRVPKIWLQWLFGLEDMPEGFGLYFVDRRAGPLPTVPGVTWAMLYDTDHSRVLAARIQCQNLDFNLSLSPPPYQAAGTPFEGAVYRPGGLTFTQESRRTNSLRARKTIQFGWRAGSHRTYINIQVAPGADPSMIEALYRP